MRKKIKSRYDGDHRKPTECAIEGCENPPIYIEYATVGSDIYGKCEEHKDWRHSWCWGANELWMFGGVKWHPPGIKFKEK